MDEYTSLKTISQNIGVNYSTLRGYAERFSAFLPTRPVDGERWEVYDLEAENILKLIASLYKKGMQRRAIREELLNSGYTETIVYNDAIASVRERGVSDLYSDSLSLPPKIKNLLHAMDEITDIQDKTIQRQRTLITELESQLEKLKLSQSIDRDQIANLRAQLEQINKGKET